VSVSRSIALHIAPGAITTLVYVLIAPGLEARGIPAVFGLVLATAFILIPLEIGWLLFEARRGNRVLFREPISRKQLFGYAGLLIGWGLLSSVLFFRADHFLQQHVFEWLPSWYMVTSVEQFAPYSRAVLKALLFFGVIIAGFAGPIVEEFYFRGYLLPRLDQFGRTAPLVHAVLFSLYHFWTPWQNPSRIALSWAMAQVTWKTRSIYPSMLAHCVLNTVVWSTTFGAIAYG
jgi:membrane protease YdiL (CAAX protease family)